MKFSRVERTNSGLVRLERIETVELSESELRGHRDRMLKALEVMEQQEKRLLQEKEALRAELTQIYGLLSDVGRGNDSGVKKG